MVIMIPVANMKSTMSRADTKITVFFRWVVGTRADTRVFTRPIQPLPIKQRTEPSWISPRLTKPSPNPPRDCSRVGRRCRKIIYTLPEMDEGLWELEEMVLKEFNVPVRPQPTRPPET
jgi:hypothetical protein